MSQKKSRLKRSTLGLIILCVLFVAALGGVILYYTNTLNNENAKLNTLLNDIDSITGVYPTYTTSEVNKAITDLNSSVNEAFLMATDEMDTINGLNALLSLNDSTVWVNNSTVTEPAAGAWYNWTFSASYAGYVAINISSATAPSWAYTEYSAPYGANYSDQILVGTNGTAYFPILPSANVTVAVGNAASAATQTVTITYYD